LSTSSWWAEEGFWFMIRSTRSTWSAEEKTIKCAGSKKPFRVCQCCGSGSGSGSALIWFSGSGSVMVIQIRI
jgi:hypothetical protein